MSLSVVASHYVDAGGGGGSTTTFVASTNGTGTTVTKPSGATTGDHLFIILADSTGNAIITGFTTIQGDTILLNDGAGSTGRGKVFYRKIDGSEGSTFTVTGSPTNVAHVAAIYRGGTGTPVLIGATTYTTATSSIVSHGRAPVAGRMIHAYLHAATTSPSITGPSSPATTRDSSVGTFYALAIADEGSSAGDDISRTATTTNKAGASVTFMFPDTGTMPAFIVSGTKTGNSANANVNIPVAAVAGDLAIVAYEVTNNTISAGPSGATAFANGQVTGGSFTCNYWWGWKVLTSGDITAGTLAITSSSQVWGAAILILRNPNATPAISGSVTSSNGHTSPVTLPSSTASAPAMAVTAMFASTNSGSAISVVDPSSVKGFAWTCQTIVNSNFGMVALNIHSCPNGASGLAPNATVPGTATISWEASTALLNV